MRLDFGNGAINHFFKRKSLAGSFVCIKNPDFRDRCTAVKCQHQPDEETANNFMEESCKGGEKA